ncbi:MHYT domain-containing protein [Nocardia crassostreae]|uniref:MHYT domain-containing protein n=1 Tax=Nocardia crassostreae TaxID=53428 RepID=UPI00083675D8
MLEIHHFSYGWLTPVLAYIMSVTGSLLGLRCTARARVGYGRKGWLIAAAIAIGGTGIWVMHFIAMLGFAIRGANIRYNIPITLLSAVIAIGVVWVGLSIVASARWRGWELIAGGAVTGLGVGAMHYSGMYAMKTDAVVHYNAGIVAVSLLIAVVAATVALWFTLHINGILATIGAALIMGVAVCGMHYTGMASMSAHEADHAVDMPAGAGAMQLLAPLMISVSMVTMVLLIHVGLTEVDEASRMAEVLDSPKRSQQPEHAAWSLQANPLERQANPGMDAMVREPGQHGYGAPQHDSGPTYGSVGARRYVAEAARARYRAAAHESAPPPTGFGNQPHQPAPAAQAPGFPPLPPGFPQTGLSTPRVNIGVPRHNRRSS